MEDKMYNKFTRNRIAVCVSSSWENYRAFSPCGFLLTKYHEKFDHYIINPLGDNNQEELIAEIKSKYDCIVSCEYAWRYVGDFKGLKLAIVDDLHRWGRQRFQHDTDILSWADIILSTYHFTDKHASYPGSISTEQRRKFVYFPHFSNDIVDGLPDFENREFAIVPGAYIENFYPMRFLSHRIPGIAIPGMNGLPELARKDFIRQIGCYKVGIICNSTLRYTVAKYFEIPMAGTVLLASDIPHPLEKYLLGFCESNSSLIPLSKEENLEYITEEAYKIVSDRDKWIELSNNGRSLVRDRHTVSSRYRYLFSIISSALHGRWSIGDQYDHFISSWEQFHRNNDIEFIDNRSSQVSEIYEDFPTQNILLVEPKSYWIKNIFYEGKLFSGDYISSDPRIRFVLPDLHNMKEIIGLSAALVKATGPYDGIFIHEEFEISCEIIDYLLSLVENDRHVYIIESKKSSKEFSDMLSKCEMVASAEYCNGYIRISKQNMEENSYFYKNIANSNYIKSNNSVNKLIIYRLLRGFWNSVGIRVQEIIGRNLIVVLDDRFWIGYGGLRIWSGENERGSARVNLEGICHEHTYIGIQNGDFEESFSGLRDKAVELCKSLKLIRSSDSFLGYEFFNDLGLPTVSADIIAVNKEIRCKFIDEMENRKEEISFFIAKIIHGLVEIEK